MPPKLELATLNHVFGFRMIPFSNNELVKGEFEGNDEPTIGKSQRRNLEEDEYVE